MAKYGCLACGSPMGVVRTGDDFKCQHCKYTWTVADEQANAAYLRVSQGRPPAKSVQAETTLEAGLVQAVEGKTDAQQTVDTDTAAESVTQEAASTTNDVPDEAGEGEAEASSTQSSSSRRRSTSKKK